MLLSCDFGIQFESKSWAPQTELFGDSFEVNPVFAGLRAPLNLKVGTFHRFSIHRTHRRRPEAGYPGRLATAAGLELFLGAGLRERSELVVEKDSTVSDVERNLDTFLGQRFI